MKTITITFLLVLCALAPANAQEQKRAATPATSGGGAPIESNFRLIGSVSGSKVLESGRLAIADPRTVFYSPDDKEIVVYFTWEGPPGQHHFEGLWKNPAGKVMMTFAKLQPGIYRIDALLDGDFVWRTVFRMIE